MLRQRFYVIYFTLAILFGVISCVPKATVVTDLSLGQDGKIHFNSPNHSTFKKLFKGGSNEQTTISGILRLPKTSSQNIPAAVILHGVAGVKDKHFNTANELRDIGIAAFVVDSQSPRGVDTVGAAIRKISYSMRVSDAYAALKLLSTHPRIDKNRIALMGFSRGGGIALLSTSEKIRDSLVSGDLRFAAYAVYYPSCVYQIDQSVKTTGTPILMLLGEKDNITPAQKAIDYAQRLRSSGADVKIVVCKGAHHSFDNPALSSKLMNYPALSDYSKCSHKYLQLQEDGTWLCSWMDKNVNNQSDLGNFMADCEVKGGGKIGDPDKARAESVKEYKAFLKKVFNLL